jgi:[ribosomal protein S5]-alanine N-acetyltransferase
VTVTGEPWTTNAPETTRVSLVAVPPPVIHALAAGHHEQARALSEVDLTPYLLGPDCTNLWSMRSRQLAADPQSAMWITRIIVVNDSPAASASVVGLAGFHGPPDENGMVEIGYRVDPFHRRQGFARSALEILLDVAAADPSVSIVRATISPDNAASRLLIGRYHFEEVGEQWDDEDGLEIIFHRPASSTQ